MTLRVVLDTNVVVSALLKPQGFEDQVLRLALIGQLQLYISPAVLAEYATVLPRPKLQLQPHEVKRTLEELHQAGSVVHPIHILSKSRDQPDKRS